MWREGMPRATGTVGHEGPGRSPTQEEVDKFIAQVEGFTRTNHRGSRRRIRRCRTRPRKR